MILNRPIRIIGYIVIFACLLFVSGQWLKEFDIKQNKAMISEINVIAVDNSYLNLLYV